MVRANLHRPGNARLGAVQIKRLLIQHDSPNRENFTLARARRHRGLASVSTLNKKCRVERIFLTFIGDNHG